MTDAERTDRGGETPDREPEMLSGTTGLGNDINTMPSGLSGSIASGTPSGPASDAGDLDAPTSVSGGPDLSGTMGGTGGMDANDAHTLDSDDLGGTTSIDTDATVGRDTGMPTDTGESRVSGVTMGDINADVTPTLDSDAVDIDESREPRQ